MKKTRFLKVLVPAIAVVAMAAPQGIAHAEHDPRHCTDPEACVEFGATLLVAYDPPTPTISAEQRLVFNNDSGIPHTVTSYLDDGESFDITAWSGKKLVVEAGQLEPGTYPFHCTLVPWMYGVLTVE